MRALLMLRNLPRAGSRLSFCTTVTSSALATDGSKPVSPGARYRCVGASLVMLVEIGTTKTESAFG